MPCLYQGPYKDTQKSVKYKQEIWMDVNFLCINSNIYRTGLWHKVIKLPESFPSTMCRYRIWQLLAYQTVPNFVCTQFNESLKCSFFQFTFLLAKQLCMDFNISSPLVTSAGTINVYSAANTLEPNQYEITEIILKTNPGSLPWGSSFEPHKIIILSRKFKFHKHWISSNLDSENSWFRPIYYTLLT
jgi:hypothetical protein